MPDEQSPPGSDRWSRWLATGRDGGDERQRAVVLDVLRRAIGALGLLERARFVRTRAEDLAEIADESVDVATTRSVLIYIAEKAAAFAAMHRVLRAGGRISLFEPINRLMFPSRPTASWATTWPRSPISPARSRQRSRSSRTRRPRR